MHIQHERLVLSSSKSDLMKAGDKVEIHYPYDRIGIVKEWGAKEMQGTATKGMELKDFGER